MNQINFLETYIPVFSFRILNSQKIGLTEEEHVKICDNKATNVLNVHYFQLFQILKMLGALKVLKKTKWWKIFEINWNLRYWWSNNPAICLNMRHTWLQLTKVLVLYITFSCWPYPCKKSKLHRIPSRYINNQRIILSDWAKGTSGNTKPKIDPHRC